MATATSEFQKTDLFGGAITAQLPVNFIDSSTIRQIPDHQEVYLARDGLTSLTIEILERVDRADDEAALKYHLDDIVDDADEAQICAAEKIQLPHVPTAQTTVLSAIITPKSPSLTPTSDTRPKAPSPPTIILLTLARLLRQKTDLLIIVNVPHPTETSEPPVTLSRSSKTALWEQGERILKEVLGSLEVRDWGLFGED